MLGDAEESTTVLGFPLLPIGCGTRVVVLREVEDAVTDVGLGMVNVSEVDSTKLVADA